MVNWDTVKTVFLDMDGTLLDLHFDNFFWREHVPKRYAQKHGLDVEGAKAELYPRFHAVEGTMNWYCLDYWTEELGLDIPQLKTEVEHLICVLPHIPELLNAMRAAGRRTVLVTNAHSKSLDLKMARTGLHAHLDSLVCAHDFGMPKEEPGFWDKLKQAEPFNNETTLLVDDSLAVLRSAREYGIRHLLGIRQPDSRAPERQVEEFPTVGQLGEMLELLSLRGTPL